MKNIAIDNYYITENKFIALLSGNFEKKYNTFIWKDVCTNQVKEYLKKNMQVIENLMAYDYNNLIRFIDLQLPNGELANWTGALVLKITELPAH